MDKNSVIERLQNKNYSMSEVKHLIGTITRVEKNRPKFLRKNDVIIRVGSGGSQEAKKRPYVVIKVLEDKCIAMPLSTTEDELNLCESQSRFFGNGFFTSHIVTIKIEDALDNFAGVYDNPRLVNKAIREMKQFLTKSLK